jgi:hypothetical protein
MVQTKKKTNYPKIYKRNIKTRRSSHAYHSQGGAPPTIDTTKYDTTMIANPAVSPSSTAGVYDEICLRISEQTDKFGGKYFANSRLPASLIYLSAPK